MKKILIIISISALASCAGWDTADKILFTTSVALNTIDCIQTDSAIKQGREEGAMPIRMIAGGTPSTGQIATYGVTINIMKYFIADALPGGYRKVFLGALIMGSTFTITHNYAVAGIRIEY